MANGDTVTISYADAAPAGTRTATATWYANATGVVSLDAASYTGTTATAAITLADADLNTTGNPDSATVTVSSTTDGVGFTMSLVESGKSTGVFRNQGGGTVPLGFTTGMSDPSGGLLRVSDGDSLTVTYNDAAPVGVRTATAVWNANSSNYYTTVTARRTEDSNGDGQIDRIKMATSDPLDDSFSGLTVTVAGYTVSSYDTGGAPNDNVFYVNLIQSGSADTGATPAVRITNNTSLKDSTATKWVATDPADVSVSDTAPPVLQSVTLADAGNSGAGSGDTIAFVYDEALSPSSISSALVGSYVNNSLAAGSGNISGALADIIGELGSFATTTTATATATPLTLSADGKTVTITLGGTVTDGTFPGGVFTPSATYTDTHGNTVSTTTTRTATGTWDSPPAISMVMTADSNGDGYIDRLVVTFNGAVNAATIVASRFSTDVGTVSTVEDDTTALSAVIWVELDDGVLGTGATPALTLAANAIENTLGTPNDPVLNYVSTDNAPPVILYTLAVAGQRNVAIQFSEPVTHSATSDFTYSGGAGVSNVPTIGTAAYLLTLSGPVTADEITNASPAVVSVSASVIDFVGFPVAVAGRTHRVSDLALGLIDPVWARTQPATSQTLTAFDGSNSLAVNGAIQLQATILSSTYAGTSVTSTYPTVDLLYDAGVPSALKSGQLWLPVFLPGLVPAADTSARSVAQSVALNRTRNFLIPSTDPEVRPGVDMEFFFKIGGLVYAKVTNAADPRSVVPWQLPLTALREQRGGVTIVHNIINSDRGDSTQLFVSLDQPGPLLVVVFDLSGDVVAILFHGTISAGEHQASWDGRNASGRSVARGIYFIRVVAPGLEELRKVLVVR